MKKAYRVKKSSEIEKILKKRQSVGNKYFVVYKNENHEVSHFRFAVSVSKKYGNAVERNKIKRHVREIVAHNNINGQFDFFIVVKIPVKDLSFQERKNQLEKLLERHKLLGEKNEQIS